MDGVDVQSYHSPHYQIKIYFQLVECMCLHTLPCKYRSTFIELVVKQSIHRAIRLSSNLCVPTQSDLHFHGNTKFAAYLQNLLQVKWKQVYNYCTSRSERTHATDYT